MKSVENMVAKGEIARFEQFLLSSQCFQKSSAANATEWSASGKGLIDFDIQIAWV